jgi:hypothetical protein
MLSRLFYRKGTKSYTGASNRPLSSRGTVSWLWVPARAGESDFADKCRYDGHESVARLRVGPLLRRVGHVPPAVHSSGVCHVRALPMQ